MSDLRERIADMNRHDDWRRRERVREIDRQEDAARSFAREIAALRGRVNSWLCTFDQPIAERDWQDVLDCLDGAAKTADSIVGACRNASDDAAAE